MITYILYKHTEHQLTLSAKNIKESDLNKDIMDLFINWEVEFADKVMIAYENDLMIGFFRYDVAKVRPYIYAAGTYVIPEYRNQNIAFNLWKKVIEIEHPSTIFAHVASGGGLNLVNKIKTAFQKIKFDCTFDGNLKAA